MEEEEEYHWTTAKERTRLRTVTRKASSKHLTVFRDISRHIYNVRAIRTNTNRPTLLALIDRT